MKLAQHARRLELRAPVFGVPCTALPISTVFTNLRHLTVACAIPGFEVLLDNDLLPALRCIYGLRVPLFVTLMRRFDPMKPLHSIEQLLIVDQPNELGGSFSLRHWYLLFDVFPCLRTCLIGLHHARNPLTFFSCCIDDSHDAAQKTIFMDHLREEIKSKCASVLLISLVPGELSVWF